MKLEEEGHPERERKAGVVLAGLDGVDRLPGYSQMLGKRRLRPLALGSQPPRDEPSISRGSSGKTKSDGPPKCMLCFYTYPMRFAAILWLGIVQAVGVAPPSAVHGRLVEDRFGSPLPSVRVRISRANEEVVIAEAETDATGRFRTAGLETGLYELTIEQDTYVPLVAWLRAQPDATEAVPVFRLIRRGVISGRVSAESGRVLAIERVGAGIPRVFETNIDRSGGFRLWDLPLGRYDLAVLNPTTAFGGSRSPRRGILVYPDTFTVSGGAEFEAIDVFVPPDPTFSLAGTILAPEEITAFTWTVIEGDRPHVTIGPTRLSSDPEFRIEDLAPGNYDVLVTGSLAPAEPILFGRHRVSVGFGDLEDVRVQLTAGRSIQFRLDERSSSDDCRPTATVTLAPIGRWFPSRTLSGTVTVEEPLVFENLPPARYAIRATDSDGSCGGIQALDLTDGGPAEPVSILLQPPGSIHGRTSPSERSSPVSVVLTDLEPGRESAVRVWIGNADGAFDFRSLPPGRYCLGIYELDSPERWSREDLGCDRTVIEVIAGQSTILEPEE